MPAPPVSRKSVCSGDRFEIENVSSKPLCVSPERDSTFTSCTASITSRGAGRGTAGPTKSWSRTGSATRVSRDIGGERDPQEPAHGLDQHPRIDRAVGVGEAPPQLRVAEVRGGEQIAAVVLDGPHLV